MPWICKLGLDILLVSDETNKGLEVRLEWRAIIQYGPTAVDEYADCCEVHDPASLQKVSEVFIRVDCIVPLCIAAGHCRVHGFCAACLPSER